MRTVRHSGHSLPPPSRPSVPAEDCSTFTRQQDRSDRATVENRHPVGAACAIPCRCCSLSCAGRRLQRLWYLGCGELYQMNVEGRPTCFQCVACWEKEKPLSEFLPSAALLLQIGSLRIRLRKDTCRQQSSKPQHHLSLRKTIAHVGRRVHWRREVRGRAQKAFATRTTCPKRKMTTARRGEQKVGDGDDE